MDFMLCPVLVGRPAELDALTSALGQAAAGRGGTIFLTGDSGVGKTRLARELSALAAMRGCLVLTGRAAQSPAPTPYRPVAEALMGAAREGITLDSPAAADYRAALGVIVPEWRQPRDGAAEISPVILGEAVLRLLALAGRRGGLLVFEDLHWADPETLAVIEYIADNLASTNVLCLITLCEGESPACDGVLRAAVSRRTARRIAVPRLKAADVLQMAAACLDVDEVPAKVYGLLADCGGLPFAVEEILAAAATSGQLVRGASGWRVNDEVSTGVPASIVGSVRSRLAALSPEVAEVIVAAAVLGRQFDWRLLPAIAGVSTGCVLDALQRASEVQLIEPVGADPGTFRFRHSLTRDAIVSGLLPPELASKAAIAAAAVEAAHPGLPGSWCELTAELHATAGQPVAAARLLLTSARRAIGQGALGSAQAVLNDARQKLAGAADAQPRPVARPPATTGLAAAGDAKELDLEIAETLTEALALAGDYERLAPAAEDLLARLEATGTNARRAALIRLRVARTRPEDHQAAAARHIQAAEATARKLNDAKLASLADAVAARHALVTGQLDLAADLARRALAYAEAGGRASPVQLPGWAREVQLVALEVIGRTERVRDLPAARRVFERARDIADATQSGAWLIRALHQLATTEMLESGSTGPLAEVHALAHRAGALSVATTVELQLANAWSLGADLDAALRSARQCERGAARLGANRLQAMACCLQANIFAVRGEAKLAHRALQAAESILPGDPEILSASWGQGRVLGALFHDDIALAIRASRTGLSFARQAQASRDHARSAYSALQEPILAPRRAWGLYALLQAVAGQDDDARAAIDEAAAAGAAASWNRGCLGYAAAVLAGRAGCADKAEALAADGDAAFAPFAPRWRHLARRLAAPAALCDHWGEPIAWMRQAAADFDATGHHRLASACRGLLRREGERVPRAGRGSAQVPAQLRHLGVTSREMDVFLLVARGLSNAQIASQLYISPKTVETHVASLIAKTGQAGRRELVAHAASLAGPDLARQCAGTRQAERPQPVPATVPGR